jgi:phosphate starvation-inducible PhoH-like protein
MGKKPKNRLPDKQSSLVHDFYPKNEKQEELVRMIEDREVVLATGVAGTGKTFVTLATALSLLGDRYKQIILVKSVTTLPGEEIGFLKGDMEQKMEPFIMSYTWNIDKICGEGSAKALMEKKIIKILPLAYIRGLSIDNSIVIIDESQNIDSHTFKTMMTRIGDNSKYIFLGDIEQIDRKKKVDSCLQTVMAIFEDSDIIGTIRFTDEDCVRNPIIPKILSTLRENGI